MKIFPKYFFQEYIKLFVLCLIIFISIFLIIDFLQRIDNFIEVNASKDMIFSYFLNKIPFITIQMIPVGVLLSIVIMFSLMKKNNEIIAIKACGLDLFKLSGIIMMISLLIGITTFLFGEMIVPYTSSKSNEIWNMEVEKYDTRRFYGGDQIWYKAPNAIYWIKHLYSNSLKKLYPVLRIVSSSLVPHRKMISAIHIKSHQPKKSH